MVLILKIFRVFSYVSVICYCIFVTLVGLRCYMFDKIKEFTTDMRELFFVLLEYRKCRFTKVIDRIFLKRGNGSFFLSFLEIFLGCRFFFESMAVFGRIFRQQVCSCLYLELCFVYIWFRILALKMVFFMWRFLEVIVERMAFITCRILGGRVQLECFKNLVIKILVFVQGLLFIKERGRFLEIVCKVFGFNGWWVFQVFGFFEVES